MLSSSPRCFCCRELFSMPMLCFVVRSSSAKVIEWWCDCWLFFFLRLLISPLLILFIAIFHCLFCRFFGDHNSQFRAVLCVFCPLFVVAFGFYIFNLLLCFSFCLPISFSNFFLLFLFCFPLFLVLPTFLAPDNLLALTLFLVSSCAHAHILFMNAWRALNRPHHLHHSPQIFCVGHVGPHHGCGHFAHAHACPK